MTADTHDTPRIAGLPSRIAWTYLALMLLAMLIYGKLWMGSQVVANDTRGYLEFAAQIREGHVSKLPMRTPGYPLLLVATGSSAGPTRTLFVVSCLLYFIAIWCSATLLAEFGASGRQLLAWALLLCLPPYFEWTAHLMTENLVRVALSTGMIALVFWFLRGGALRLLLAAVLLAYAALANPAYQVLPVGLGMLLVLLPLAIKPLREHLRRGFAAALTLAGVTILTLGAYAYFNYTHFGFFGTSYLAGTNLTTRVIKVVERLPDEHAVAREILIKSRDSEMTQRNSSHSGVHYALNVVPELRQATGMSEIQVHAYLTRISLILIVKAPLNYLVEVLQSCCTYWMPTSTRLANLNSGAAQLLWSVLQIGITAFFFLQTMAVFGALCLTVARQGWGPLLHERHAQALLLAYALMAAAVACGVLVSCAVGHGDCRYQVPIQPFVLMMLFLGVALWRRLLAHTPAGLKKGATAILCET